MSDATHPGPVQTVHSTTPSVAGERKPPVRRAVPAPAVVTAPAVVAEAPIASSWRRLLRNVESWTGSVVVHVVIILLLALLSFSVPTGGDVAPIISTIATRPQELVTQRLDESLEASQSLSISASSSLAVAQSATTLSSAAEPQLDQRVVEDLNAPAVSLADVSLASLPTSELTNSLGMNSPGDPAAAVSGYGGALDRVSQQLMLMLNDSKVLVVWLFDQSESMKDDQQEVKKRIDRVYTELGLTKPDDGDALLTAVASFGDKVVQHTRRPTNDLAIVHTAIDEIPIDESGKEMMCRAVIETTNAYRKFAVQGGRQLALVVVTDESGDDGEQVEAAIAAARSAHCMVYVIGAEAAFGYPYAYLNWSDPETKLTKWLRINRGPETAFVEQLQTDGLWIRRDWHASGFGPYEQVRLCRETGGTFFMLPRLEANLVGTAGGERRIYALEAMRPYLPDLDSREAYLYERQKHDMHTALGQIIAMLNPWDRGEVALTENFRIDKNQPNNFFDDMRAQQRKALQLIEVYVEAEKLFEELLPLREKEVSPRWQANFDLLRAQVVAYKIRCYEYGAYLEAFMQNPKTLKDPKTTHWQIYSVPRLITGDVTKDFAAQATELLQQVAAEHPGTPFSERAEWELKRGFGVDIREWFYDSRIDDIKWPNP